MFVLAYDNTEDDIDHNNQVFIDSFKKYFLPRVLKQKIAASKLREEIFKISQLMTQSSNMTKSEKYQQDKVMITQLVVFWILLILKKITD